MPKLTSQQVIADAMSEADLLRNVTELAHGLGYTVAHIRDSRRQMVEGYPDLVIAGHARLIHVELKVENESKGKLSPWQERWRTLILSAQHEYYLWRPSDWLSGEIEMVLKERR